ncbi:MAG: MarR family transcriptional regulator [Burkholderiales bacterium]|jgi:predicted transcriptional regulator|nr:MarR family transcriptional regulator [Burkholderiales bacterium]
MKTLKVGIMSATKFQQRVLDIAAGRYKPTSGEPKVWFSSLKSLAEVLNENNTRLLTLIEKMKPASLTELAKISGRQASNLSRTLKTFERYGIVELKKENKLLKPIVKATNFQIEYKSA